MQTSRLIQFLLTELHADITSATLQREEPQSCSRGGSSIRRGVTVSPSDQPLHPLVPEVDSPQATGAVTIWRFTGALGSFTCGHAGLSQHQRHAWWAAQPLGCGPGLQGAGEEPGWEEGGFLVEVLAPRGQAPLPRTRRGPEPGCERGCLSLAL